MTTKDEITIPIVDIAKLSLRPGDVVMVRTKEFHPDHITMMLVYMRQAIPEPTKILIVPEDFELTIISEEQEKSIQKRDMSW